MAQAEKSLPDLLSVGQLADYLDIPVSTIHFWRGRGEGPPAIKVGRRLRWRVEDVVRWLEEREGAHLD